MAAPEGLRLAPARGVRGASSSPTLRGGEVSVNQRASWQSVNERASFQSLAPSSVSSRSPGASGRGSFCNVSGPSLGDVQTSGVFMTTAVGATAVGAPLFGSAPLPGGDPPALRGSLRGGSLRGGSLRGAAPRQKDAGVAGWQKDTCGVVFAGLASRPARPHTAFLANQRRHSSVSPEEVRRRVSAITTADGDYSKTDFEGRKKEPLKTLRVNRPRAGDYSKTDVYEIDIPKSVVSFAVEPSSPEFWKGRLHEPAVRAAFTATVMHQARRHKLRNTMLAVRRELY
ncbi:hypothetical protein M885DRAFT_550357 [Pelagophyceae sp. CCMP2097]|nr:hypothetical protein M885DRAFT_550357 [Pelagophyceae sp. CCMP2097]